LSRSKRKHHEEEHENHERWLVSYADFMTLLFAFFVVMYSVSRVDSKRMAQAAAAIRWALHYSGTGGVSQMPIFEGPPSEGGCVVNLSSGSPDGLKEQLPIEMLRRRMQRRLRSFVVDQRVRAAVTISSEGRRIAVRLAAGEFFEPGQAVLRPQVLPMLDAIADELVTLKRMIRVEGHTDSRPTTGGRFRDNWELSAARAASVVTYLESAHHAAPELLQAVGMGSAHPISPESDELNRRVEMVVELAISDPLLNDRSRQ
jgi:chemotaxis protein MotB